MSERDDLDRRLSAWLDGELPEAEARELAERVARDPALVARRDRLARVDEGLRALAAPGLPGDLRERLAARIATAERVAPLAPRRRRWAIPAAAALAAGLALYLAVGSRPPRAVPTPQPQTPPVADTPEIEADDAELALAFEYELLRDFDVIDRLDELEALAAYERALRSDRS